MSRIGTLRWSGQPDDQQSGSRSSLHGFLPALARLLLILGLVSSLFWVPLFESGGLGTVTVADFCLLCLWPITLIYLLASLRLSRANLHPFWIAVLATIIGLLSAVAAYSFTGSPVSAVSDLALHMKRFGLASIIPLALWTFGSRRFTGTSVIVIAVSLVLISVFSIFPQFQRLLPAYQSSATSLEGDVRATGAVSNPNDLAYVSVLALCSIYGLAVNVRKSVFSNIVVGIASLSGLANIVLSGSRSGVLSLLAAASFIVVRSRMTKSKKLILLASVLVAGFVGFQLSDIFASRIQRAYNERLGDASISIRLQMQAVAAEVSLRHPIGVGMRNFVAATKGELGDVPFTQISGSDSIYFDTLVATGFAGLLVLVALYRLIWLYQSTCPPRPRVYFSGGFVAALVFGCASVSPSSVYVAPLFFFTVGAAGLYSFNRD